MSRRYNCILFDLDDTLLSYSREEKNCILKVLENHELPHSDDVITLFDEINDWHTFELGREITCYDVIVNHFARLLKMLEVKGEQLDSCLNEFYEGMRKSSKLNKGALKTLKYLKDNGYRIYITSNGYPDFQYPRIKKARISKFFDGFFISEEIGHKKPSPAFFNYVFTRIPESNRSKVLVVGDAPTADILGGINAKFDTVWVSNGKSRCKYKSTYTIKNIDELINIL
ncbi:MAG: HAD-IA family hydrolase [Clostridia bacterium]|nr:HAD-IA family hydrolase [Clostridia bacterium]